MILGSIPLAFAFTVISLRNLSLVPNYPLIQFLVVIGFVIEVLVIAFTFTRWYRDVEIDRDFLKLRISVEAQEKQIAVQAAEQRVKDRIARDLHDDVAASMSGIRILSQVAIRQAANNTQNITPLLQQITRSAQATLDGLSDIIWAINAHTDYLNDVADRIRDYAVRTLEAHDIAYHLEICRNLPAMDLDVEARRNIYLIFKESVNNVLKHSQCKSMEIKLLVEDGFMTLIVADDGVGFDMEAVQRGHGLDNLEKRAQDIGGKVEISAAPGQGTKIVFLLPLPAGTQSQTAPA
jgi:signal transduction histidine kinase